MASARCQELELVYGHGELVYGHGELVTKHERPTILEGNLDRDEGDIIVNEGEQTLALKKTFHY